MLAFKQPDPPLLFLLARELHIIFNVALYRRDLGVGGQRGVGALEEIKRRECFLNAENLLAHSQLFIRFFIGLVLLADPDFRFKEALLRLFPRVRRNGGPGLAHEFLGDRPHIFFVGFYQFLGGEVRRRQHFN